MAVSTRSRPKAAGEEQEEADKEEAVSTRSRPKAAGRKQNRQRHASYRFNTQPPEGGWLQTPLTRDYPQVSTRSRPKAAGLFIIKLMNIV